MKANTRNPGRSPRRRRGPRGLSTPSSTGTNKATHDDNGNHQQRIPVQQMSEENAESERHENTCGNLSPRILQVYQVPDHVHQHKRFAQTQYQPPPRPTPATPLKLRPQTPTRGTTIQGTNSSTTTP